LPSCRLSVGGGQRGSSVSVSSVPVMWRRGCQRERLSDWPFFMLPAYFPLHLSNTLVLLGGYQLLCWCIWQGLVFPVDAFCQDSQRSPPAIS